MSDVPDIDRPEPVRSPRCSVQFDGDGTWSAWRGAIPLAGEGLGLLEIGVGMHPA